MKSEWKVTMNPIAGKIMYGVYRIIDTSQPVHSGNVENYGEYVESRKEAEERAKYMNVMEEAK
jgi:hypothetical protein